MAEKGLNSFKEEFHPLCPMEKKKYVDLRLADWEPQRNLRICDLRFNLKNLRICDLRTSKPKKFADL
jgi:hypothetical protein